MLALWRFQNRILRPMMKGLLIAGVGFLVKRIWPDGIVFTLAFVAVVTLDTTLPEGKKAPKRTIFLTPPAPDDSDDELRTEGLHHLAGAMINFSLIMGLTALAFLLIHHLRWYLAVVLPLGTIIAVFVLSNLLACPWVRQKRD